ncbi:MAG: VOC family protein [Rubrivivax sp.]
MFDAFTSRPGRFCWLDLAATDAARARRFYADAFGWRCADQPANGGIVTRLRCGDDDMGTLYELSRRQQALGVPSHWTPYIGVADLDALLQRLPALGGRVVVPPVSIDALARVALVEDAVGALLGLWQLGAKPR